MERETGYANLSTLSSYNGTEFEESVFTRVLSRILTPLVFCLITVIGLAGNLMVIYIITTRRKMRTLTNMMLLNLAVADVCFLVTCPPFTALHFASVTWPFGLLTCRLMLCATNVTVYVTVYTLVLICVVRYMAIVHPSSTDQYRTRNKIAVVMVLIWVVMICVAAPFGKIFGLQLDRGVLVCVVVDLEYGKSCFMFSFIFAYCLPVLIIGALSALLLRHIHSESKGSMPLRSTASQRSRQAACVIKLVVLAFILLWLPINVDLLLFYYGCNDYSSSCPAPEWQHVFQVLARCLAYSNSCVNPFIYNFASRDFRSHFWDALHCRRRESRPSRPIGLSRTQTRRSRVSSFLPSA